MNSKENLVFLGMKGSGKSSIGSLVSKKLNINFIDVDIEIEKKLDLKISEIFEDKGEKYFRQIEETETLKALSKKRPIAHKSSKKEIEELIEKRSIIYSKAMYKINCVNLTKNEIVKKIIKIYETY